MKVLTLFLSVLLLATSAIAQDKKIYNPAADAIIDIENAVKKASAENKFVLIQGGGNWCGWCIEFARFCKTDKQIDSILSTNFIWYHLNYSKENENKTTFTKYDFPQRFGFPVFIILNTKGEKIHIQQSDFLEDGKKSYDKEKVISFLNNWSPKALDPKEYN
jgi:thioredoxin-related protein